MSTETDLLLIAAGITYRQLDYWVRKGWVEPRFWRRNGERVGVAKSGYRRDFTDQEARVVIRMGHLTRGGVRADVAAVAARSMVDRDEDTARLDGGVTVQLQVPSSRWDRPTEQHVDTVEQEGSET